MKTKVLLGIIFAETILIIALVAQYWDLAIQYSALKEQHQFLLAEYSALQAKYASLNQTYASLLEEISTLQQKVEELNQTNLELILQNTVLENEYNSLMQQYTLLEERAEQLNETCRDLQAQNEQLQETIAQLNSSYLLLQENYTALNETYTNLLQEYSSLEAQYNQTKQEYQSFLAAYEKLVKKVNLHVFHPNQDEKLLIDPEATAEYVLSITGGWETGTMSEFWEDIKDLYYWVINNIRYRYDSPYPILPSNPDGKLSFFAEVWQFPNQTLDLELGDCEDMAILLTSMILKYIEGAQTTFYIEVIVITQHAAMYISNGTGICILDASGRYYTNDLGTPCFKDVEEEVNNWLDYWERHGLLNPRVYWIFSSYIWQSFDSTSEFINWMYHRG